MQTGSHRVAGLIFRLGEMENKCSSFLPQRDAINVQFQRGTDSTCNPAQNSVCFWELRAMKVLVFMRSSEYIQTNVPKKLPRKENKHAGNGFVGKT